MRLNQLQPFVHHRRRIDADLCAHVPIRVRHRLRRSYAAHLIERKSAERAAACSQRDFADLVDTSARKALKYRVMLAIHGQQRRARARHRRHHHRTSRNQRFFIGQCHSLAHLNRRQCRFQSSTADNRRHGPVSAHLRRRD